MATLTLVVGTKNLSSWSLRPWLLARQLGADFEEIVIYLDQPDSADKIRAHSPSGRVPLLKHGEVVVWDSIAICEYLAELYPAARAWPEDRAARAHARAISAEMHAGFPALRQNLSMDIRAEHKAPKARTPEVEHDIARIREIWRDCRTRYAAGGPFLFGHFTVADAMYAPVVSRFRTYDVALDGPEAEYARTIWNLPAMQEWLAAARAET